MYTIAHPPNIINVCSIVLNYITYLESVDNPTLFEAFSSMKTDLETPYPNKRKNSLTTHLWASGGHDIMSFILCYIITLLSYHILICNIYVLL